MHAVSCAALAAVIHRRSSTFLILVLTNLAKTRVHCPALLLRQKALSISFESHHLLTHVCKPQMGLSEHILHLFQCGQQSVWREEMFGDVLLCLQVVQFLINVTHA